MSSIEAEEMIKVKSNTKRDGRIDSLAAKIILERFLAKNHNLLIQNIHNNSNCKTTIMCYRKM